MAGNLPTQGWAIDDAAQRIHFNRQMLTLTPIEFRLLRTLLGKPGRVFSRAQLLDTLRAFLDNSSNPAAVARNLYVHVNTLRNRPLKIKEITGADPYIEENRVGYRVGLWAVRRLGLPGSDSSGYEPTG